MGEGVGVEPGFPFPQATAPIDSSGSAARNIKRIWVLNSCAGGLKIRVASRGRRDKVGALRTGRGASAV